MRRVKTPSGWIAVLPLLTLACQTRAESTSPPVSLPAEPGTLRAATHSGSWYPGDRASLRQAVHGHLAKHPIPKNQVPVIALVGPHAGIRFSGDVAAAGYKLLASQTVRRAFLLGPTHHASFEGIALPAADIAAYETPLGNLRIDGDAIAALRGQPGFGGPARAHVPEHSLEMHAIFLAAVHPNALTVPLVVGRVRDSDHARQLADGIRKLMRPDDVVLVSSDFTHYGPRFGYVPFTKEVPQQLLGLMRAAYEPLASRDLAGFEAHLSKTGDTICGREPIRILLALLPDDAVAAKAAEDTSGHMTDDFSNSVSYLAVSYRRHGGWHGNTERHARTGQEQGTRVLDPAQQKEALTMARATINAYLRDGKKLDDGALSVPDSGPFRETYSVFVTLKKHGQLRGCVGHILPIQALWLDIRDNAISAAVHDNRFPSVKAEELDQLHLEISVLTPPREIDGPEQFIVGRHGIILSAHGRRAVYLPQVAPEQGWDRTTTLTHLARKAGLPGDAWRSSTTQLRVFEAQVFAEPE
ncbi:AmmeMemoRadiSam system protein A [Myxococcota bacterium]